ncbi:MAG: TRAP transporter small permease subunit [Burkholderiales bacterium]
MDTAPPNFDDARRSDESTAQRGRLYRAYEGVLMGLNSIGTVWIFVLMFLICADVIARSGFNHPIDGVTDISAFSIIGIVFLQIGATVHTGRMTKGDVLLEIITKRSERWGAVVESVFLFVGAAMFALIVHASWLPFTRSFGRNEFFGVEGVFTFPTWPIRLIIVVGAAAVTLAYLVQITDLLRKAIGNGGGVR